MNVAGNGEKQDGKAGARKAIRDLADRSTELLERYFEDALRVEKITWLDCKHCGRRSQVPTPDRAAISRTIELMLSEGYGKPRSEEETGGIELIVQRWLPMPSLEDGLTSEELETLAAAREIVERVDAETSPERIDVDAEPLEPGQDE
jgi:hypothetical protein